MSRLMKAKCDKYVPPDLPKAPAFIRLSRVIGGPNTYIFKADPNDKTIFEVPKSFTPVVQYTGVKTNVLRHTFAESGFLVQFENMIEWDFTWSKSQRDEFFLTMSSPQKVNHFPRTYELGRKDNLSTNMQRMKALYGSEFDFYPTTYFYPEELDKCTQLLYDSKIKRNEEYRKMKESKDSSNNEENVDSPKELDGLVIIKPIASSRGRGIRLATGLPDPTESRGLIVQEYIDNPLLLDGYKFDLRIYVLLTSIDPPRILVYRDGLVRKATKKYVPYEDCMLRDIQYTHLTNFSLNCNSTDFVAPKNEDDEDASKMKISHMLEHFAKTGHKLPITEEGFWEKVDRLVVKTISAAYPHIKKSYNNAFGVRGRRNGCFEMYGFDFMIDENFDFHLIEVNTSPATATGSILDKRLKYPLIECMMNIVGIEPREELPIPDELKSQLASLQQPPPEGVDPVIAAEEERIASMGGLWKRVFPAPHTDDLAALFSS